MRFGGQEKNLNYLNHKNYRFKCLLPVVWWIFIFFCYHFFEKYLHRMYGSLWGHQSTQCALLYICFVLWYQTIYLAYLSFKPILFRNSRWLWIFTVLMLAIFWVLSKDWTIPCFKNHLCVIRKTNLYKSWGSVPVWSKLVICNTWTFALLKREMFATSSIVSRQIFTLELNYLAIKT